MAVYLAPIANGDQFFNLTGQVLSGGKINTYLAGTTTPAATYTTNSGLVPNANPIILNSAGLLPNEIWLTGGVTYKFVITDAANNVLQTLDNLAGINDPSAVGIATTAQEWLPAGAPTYISGTQCSFVGNLTATLTPGRRVQANVTAGTIYGTITSSVYSGGVTTITVQWDSGAFDSGLSSVNYGILSYQNPSSPWAPLPYYDTIASASTINLDAMYGQQIALITGTTTITNITLAAGKNKIALIQNNGLTFSTSGNINTSTGRNLVCNNSDRVTIFSTGPNVYLTITRALYPNFHALGSQVLSSGVITKAVLNTVVFNDGNCFDGVTNYRFTPTVPGRYLISFSAAAGTIGVAQQVGGFLYKNGVQYTNGPYSYSSSVTSSLPILGTAQAYVVDFNGSSDYVELFLQQTSVGNAVTFSGSMSGCKVDP
jgi:hypothetical protein